MAIEVFNRYEYKYFLDCETYKKIIEVMNAQMVLDAYSKNQIPYTIANIYYDTADDYLIRTSLSRPEYKEKIRLRAYGIPEINSEVFLEIKKKFEGRVNKRRTKLCLNEAYDFIKSGIAPVPKQYMNAQVLRELEYFMSVYKLTPKLYLAYDRIAYFEKNNSDLRISFDSNIRGRRYDLRLDLGDHGEKIIDGDVYLMEIKTSFAMPLWLTEVLTEYGIKRRKFSKYGTEFKHYISSNSENLKFII